MQKNCYFHKIKEKILLLHQKLQTMTAAPFTVQQKYNYIYDSIIDYLDSTVTKVDEMISKEVEENLRRSEIIKQKCNLIGMENYKVAVGNNLCENSVYLENEIERLKLIEADLMNKIYEKKRKIQKICDEISVEKKVVLKDKSLKEQIEITENMFNELVDVKQLLEGKKHEKIVEIIEMIHKLEIKNLDEVETKIIECKDVKIGLVERKLQELREVHKNRSDEICTLDREIYKNKKFLMNIDFDENLHEMNMKSIFGEEEYKKNENKKILELKFSDKLTQTNLEKKRNYLETLQKIKTVMFTKIFKSRLNEMREISIMFKIESEDMSENEENLEKITRFIEEMSPKKDLFSQIMVLDGKRKDLLKAMVNFEKVASDPKRLFKSSFQLLDEEKFRKNAGPNLLKIEKDLLTKIDEYEENFGVLTYEGDFKSKLIEEIQRRIINKSVFILGGFDTPRKRKK